MICCISGVFLPITCDERQVRAALKLPVCASVWVSLHRVVELWNASRFHTHRANIRELLRLVWKSVEVVLATRGSGRKVRRIVTQISVRAAAASTAREFKCWHNRNLKKIWRLHKPAGPQRDSWETDGQNLPWRWSIWQNTWNIPNASCAYCSIIAHIEQQTLVSPGTQRSLKSPFSVLTSTELHLPHTRKRKGEVCGFLKSNQFDWRKCWADKWQMIEFNEEKYIQKNLHRKQGNHHVDNSGLRGFAHLFASSVALLTLF